MYRNKDFIISIENSADIISRENTEKTVKHVLERYDVSCAENLGPVMSAQIFDEMDSIEANNR